MTSHQHFHTMTYINLKLHHGIIHNQPTMTKHQYRLIASSYTTNTHTHTHITFKHHFTPTQCYMAGPWTSPHHTAWQNIRNQNNTDTPLQTHRHCHAITTSNYSHDSTSHLTAHQTHNFQHSTSHTVSYYTSFFSAPPTANTTKSQLRTHSHMSCLQPHNNRTTHTHTCSLTHSQTTKDHYNVNVTPHHFAAPQHLKHESCISHISSQLCTFFTNSMFHKLLHINIIPHITTSSQQNKHIPQRTMSQIPLRVHSDDVSLNHKQKTVPHTSSHTAHHFQTPQLTTTDHWRNISSGSKSRKPKTWNKKKISWRHAQSSSLDHKFQISPGRTPW